MVSGRTLQRWFQVELSERVPGGTLHRWLQVEPSERVPGGTLKMVPGRSEGLNRRFLKEELIGE